MRSPAIFAIALALVVGMPVGPSLSVALAGPEEEAVRQLEFARAEIEAGDYEKAVRSAESAFRLSPILYEALVVKAMAYHGLGSSDLALTLLGAYAELAPNGSSMEEAKAAEETIKADMEADRLANKRPGLNRKEKTDPLGRPPVDPQPYVNRVEKALSAGQCLVARSAAIELVDTAPRMADGWKLLGDAARCDGEAREAALAYRRYVDLGGEDATIISTLKGLRRSLGVLEVSVEIPDVNAAVSVNVRFGDDVVEPEPYSGGARRFVDLPTRRELTLEVRGRGLEAIEQELKPLVPEERRLLTVSPQWIGLGSIALTRPTCPCEVVFFSLIDAAPGVLGSTTKLTAGQITAEIRNQHGVIEVPIELTADTTVDLDPVPWAPSALTLIGLPAGSTATLTLETLAGPPEVRELHLPSDVGELDPQTGVRIAPPQALDSMLGGTGELVITHPVLGQDTIRMVIEPGTVNASTFDWRSLPAVQTISESYEAWTKQAQAKRAAALAAPIPPAVVALSGLGVGVGFLVAALQGQSQADSLRSTYEAELATGTQIGLQRSWQAWNDQVVQVEKTWTGVAIGGGVAGLGGVITLVVGAAPKKGGDLGEWAIEEAASLTEADEE
jgi:tetratricopeptide (TPR) repeat protein